MTDTKTTRKAAARKTAASAPPPQVVPDVVEAVTTIATITPMSVLEQAVRDGSGVEVLERLLGLQERYAANQARQAFDAAMAALRADLPTIAKSRKVDFTTDTGRTHYQYEDLAAVTEAVSPAMAKQGLSFRWHTDSSKGAITVTCIVSHRAGHNEQTTLSCPADGTGNKNNIQAIGSAVTYLQRYTLKAALGLAAAVDDDARTADAPAPEPPLRARRNQAPPPPAKPRGTKISDNQKRRLWTIVKHVGRTKEEVAVWLAAVYNLHHSGDIDQADYDAIIAAVEAKGPLAPPRDEADQRVPGEEG